MLARLLAQTRIPDTVRPDATLADAFELAQKVVLGKHNLRTATVLNEFRAGSSRLTSSS